MEACNAISGCLDEADREPLEEMLARLDRFKSEGPWEGRTPKLYFFRGDGNNGKSWSLERLRDSAGIDIEIFHEREFHEYVRDFPMQCDLLTYSAEDDLELEHCRAIAPLLSMIDGDQLVIGIDRHDVPVKERPDVVIQCLDIEIPPRLRRRAAHVFEFRKHWDRIRGGFHEDFEDWDDL